MSLNLEIWKDEKRKYSNLNKIKILVIGEQFVGKTTFLENFCCTNDNYKPKEKFTKKNNWL